MYVTAEINDQKIPVNSKFWVAPVDILGTKCIDIELSDNQNFYYSGDTAQAYLQPIDTTQLVELTNTLLDISKDIAIGLDSLTKKLNNSSH